MIGLRHHIPGFLVCNVNCLSPVSTSRQVSGQDGHNCFHLCTSVLLNRGKSQVRRKGHRFHESGERCCPQNRDPIFFLAQSHSHHIPDCLVRNVNCLSPVATSRQVSGQDGHNSFLPSALQPGLQGWQALDLHPDQVKCAVMSLLSRARSGGRS